jgi:hypothetical protein
MARLLAVEEALVVSVEFLACGVGETEGGVKVGDGETVLGTGFLAAQALLALTLPFFQAVSVGGGEVAGGGAVLLVGIGVGLDQVEPIRLARSTLSETVYLRLGLPSDGELEGSGIRIEPFRGCFFVLLSMSIYNSINK